MFASGLLGGSLGYVVAAPFFHASRVAHVADDGAGGLRALAALARRAALFKGAPLLVARGATVSSVQLVTYDGCKSALRARGAEEGPALHAACSVAASITLTTAMCPLDVTLTRPPERRALREGRSGIPTSSPASVGRVG